MIVADTNLIAYLLIQGQFSPLAVSVFDKDPIWVAPWLWKSEFRNVLGLYMHRGLLDLDATIGIMEEAERLIQGQEFETISSRVLRLASISGCSTYDCEFVALAQELGVALVTSDKLIIEKFKPMAISMEAFCAQRGAGG